MALDNYLSSFKFPSATRWEPDDSLLWCECQLSRMEVQINLQGFTCRSASQTNITSFLRNYWSNEVHTSFFALKVAADSLLRQQVELRQIPFYLDQSGSSSRNH